uniref:ATP synthase complex subunit 8 n=1 Tax=Scutigera coleoptrata TaxID=29022 RepID=Q70XS3_SCUCO|nr:ATP synthase F0 subunit 8 [Scutigera coleoptrata]CAE01475.1 ATP synthase F0 subunit 8 [Scutigera coleoptrata]
MPQMAPMNWILMSIMFIITLMIIISITHSFFMDNKSNELPSILKEQIKWKW